MSWFDNVKSPKLKSNKKMATTSPEGLWKKCTSCGEILQTAKLSEAFGVCPYCNFHFRLSATDRLELLIDVGTFHSFDAEYTTNNPLNFTDKKNYDQRLSDAYNKTGYVDGTIFGTGEISGKKVAIAVMNFDFLGGSMGVVAGEKIAQVFDEAYRQQIPAIVISSSGGARMQEGILSLMQMAKTSASRNRLKEAHLPYISVLADPTTGGVAASFSMLGDLNIAEPGSLIGFAGPRVIEQSIRQTLPKGFQRAEFLVDHGFVDRIVHRHELKNEISFFIKMFERT